MESTVGSELPAPTWEDFNEYGRNGTREEAASVTNVFSFIRSQIAGISNRLEAIERQLAVLPPVQSLAELRHTVESIKSQGSQPRHDRNVTLLGIRVAGIEKRLRLLAELSTESARVTSGNLSLLASEEDAAAIAADLERLIERIESYEQRFETHFTTRKGAAS
jgi:hypothetical protein